MHRLASYSHRPCWRGHDEATDRLVLCDDVKIGRVRLDYQNTGRWQWCCQFGAAILDHTGRVDDMATALEAIRERYEREGRPGPTRHSRPPLRNLNYPRV